MPMSGLGEIIRDGAVAEVDATCGGGGHTMEFCWNPEQHAADYDREEERMLNLHTVGLLSFLDIEAGWRR